MLENLLATIYGGHGFVYDFLLNIILLIGDRFYLIRLLVDFDCYLTLVIRTGATLLAKMKRDRKCVRARDRHHFNETNRIALVVR